MAPNINNPGGVKNDPDEIRDGVVSDATRFPGGFIDQQVSESGASVQVAGKHRVSLASVIFSFDVSSQGSDPTGVAIKPDGSRLYVTDKSSFQVSQYLLSTPFDVSTASIETSLDTFSQDSQPEGVVFKPDGTKVYVVGTENDNVYEYDLSTSFDVGSASFNQSVSTTPQDSSPQGLALKPDGTKLYIAGDQDDSVDEFDLSTSFDISTASFSQSFDVSPQTTSIVGLTFRPDGRRMYVLGNSSGSVFQYTLTTGFDVSSASFGVSFSTSTQTTAAEGIAFSADGGQLYVIDRNTQTLFQYAVGNISEALG